MGYLGRRGSMPATRNRSHPVENSRPKSSGESPNFRASASNTGACTAGSSGSSAGWGRLKGQRRALYRRIDGLKRSWFGHVANVRAALAEKYGAVVAAEALSVLAVEKTDPGYKGENRSAQPIGLSSGESKGSNALGPAPRAGKTFNKLVNNGARGKYTRRADDILKWRGIATLKLPSFYSSSTDWRTGTVDKEQRSGSRFRARDGTEWDADLHAAELLARWLFLRPKPAAPAAASTM